MFKKVFLFMMMCSSFACLGMESVPKDLGGLDLSDIEVDSAYDADDESEKGEGESSGVVVYGPVYRSGRRRILHDSRIARRGERKCIDGALKGIVVISKKTK